MKVLVSPVIMKNSTTKVMHGRNFIYHRRWKVGSVGGLFWVKIIKFRGMKVFIAKIWNYGTFGEIDPRARTGSGTDKRFDFL